MRISDLDTRSAALGESTAYFAVDQASSNVTHKIDYNALARAIIEQYTGSNIGGAAQSVKAALDTVSTRVIRQGIAANTDLNDIIIPGFYSCATGSSAGSALNKPDGVASSLFLLNVYQLDNPSNPSQMSVVQEYISDTYGGYHYIRSKSGSTWTEWKAMHSIRSMPVTIDANTDLNTITNVGTYRVTTVANAKTIINKPSDLESPFIMDVRWSRTTDVKMQIIYEWLGSAIYIRRCSRVNSWADATFSDWIKQPTRAEMDATANYATEALSGVNVVMYRYGHNALLRIDATFNQSSSYVEVGKFTNMSTFNNFYFSYVNPGNGNKAKLKYVSDGTLSIMCPDGDTAIDASFPLLLS